jgi:type I restriction-modification system DNA methylase subunit
MEFIGLSRHAANDFVIKWAGTTDEQQNSQLFWTDFFQLVLNIQDLKAAGVEFEKKVISSVKGTTTRIDVYWKDYFLVEQKSAGKDLNAAEDQALQYVKSLPPLLRPPVVIVCDFIQIRIVDVILKKTFQFPVSSLGENLHRFEELLQHRTENAIQEQVVADQRAAQLMADLYIELEKFGYEGHEASVFLVRVLFCLFADYTTMWKKDIFKRLVKDTHDSGSDLGPRLAQLFSILNTQKNDRRGPLDDTLLDFPYVNGGVFSENLAPINFNASMRKALIQACDYDWSQINPTIFGALFQNIKSKEERHANGEHYTTEPNIEKIINPLFLDDLNKKVEAAWESSSKLKQIQSDLGAIKLFDPACGCGNFLITSYKRLRQLELDVVVRIKELEGSTGQTSLFDATSDLKVSIKQLHGIEFVEWSSQIAKVAIYLADHQENLKLETVLGVASNRFPLVDSAIIVHANALKMNWNEVCEPTINTYVLGNPPFLGSSWQSDLQREDTKAIWGQIKGSSSLDYVANWYILAARYAEGTGAKCAFVSTNSITQGEQPSILWTELYSLGFDIDFAHRSFSWFSDVKGQAAVHCVIIGFSQTKTLTVKQLWSYESPISSPIEVKATNINAYLVEAQSVLIRSRSTPLNPRIQPMRYGNMPNEFGYLANIYEDDVAVLKASGDPALRFIRPLIGAAEMLQDKKRFCLWLVDASPAEMNSSKFIRERVEMVRKLRLESKRKATVRLAETPYLFQEIREQEGQYLAVPIVSSESREYVPMKIFDKEVVPTNALLTVPSVDLSTFAILQSRVFSSWLSAIGGRLESRFRISAEIVYNNFPFPDLSKGEIDKLTESANLLIKIRNEHVDSSLADLYVPALMPKDLRIAHQKNDAIVMSIFGLKSSVSDEVLLSRLFNLYSEMSSR